MRIWSKNLRQGCRDAVLIEKGELTSGSTWHAAGQVPHFAESPLFARIQYESFESMDDAWWADKFDDLQRRFKEWLIS